MTSPEALIATFHELEANVADARRNAFYDTNAFREAWWSDEPIWSIAKRIGVSPVAVHRAAMRRGFPGRYHIRAAA